jgi:hypothetical protein
MVFEDTAHAAAIVAVETEAGTISMASCTGVDVSAGEGTARKREGHDDG